MENKTFVQELTDRIKEKNSWGKNELLLLISELLIKYSGL